jgi:hypothetical protein
VYGGAIDEIEGAIAMSSLIDAGDARWFRFLARWCGIAGLVNLGLILAFSIFVLPAAQNSALPDDYAELVAASQSPALYRLTITLDLTGWLMLGGFLIAFAAVLAHRAPLRATFLAACGVGQAVGMLGAFARLQGTSLLAAQYITVAPDQQAALLQSYHDLQLFFTSAFGTGALLWGVALVLTASVVWATANFPRWLSGLIALPGIIELPKSVIQVLSGADLGFLILLELPLLIAAYFAVAAVFWRRAPALAPELRGAPVS